jgi:DNA (cytosine-5)-methyltransferase 1
MNVMNVYENTTENSSSLLTGSLKKKRIVSLFSGCGGLDYGFHQNEHFEHVLVNDFDKDSCKTYELNFGIKPICQDVKSLNDIPDCDLLLGGFPCQGFSLANPFRSENDDRNHLYLEILRILKLKMPSYFLLENVKGILSMGGYESVDDKNNKRGRVIKIIQRDLENCGYNVYLQLFDLKRFGVPQKRQRVFILGIRQDKNFLPNWPVEDKITPLTLQDTISDMSIEYNQKIQHIGTLHKCVVNGYLGNRQLKWDEPSPTITGRGGGSGGPVIHNHPSLQRRLTVRECARIQTFPDDFQFVGSISSMYRQIGNAVPCKFSERLAKMIQDWS